MKKGLFVLLVAMIAILALAVSAYATYPPHGQKGDLDKPFFDPYESPPGSGNLVQPDGCAGCHRAHTAVGERLAFETGTDTMSGGITPEGSASAFCLVCHGLTGNLANTNVVDGILYSDRYQAGGSTKAGDLSGGAFRGMTSSHEVDGTARTNWGGGDAEDEETGNTMALDCGSCHDPHGTPNYRLLKTDETGKQVNSLEPGYGTTSYAPDFDGTGHYAKGTVSNPADVNGGISSHCWKCHKKYKRTDTSDDTDGV